MSAEAEAFAAGFDRIVDAVETYIQGKREVVERSVICLLAEGHLLLEDVPGVGKTSLARSLAAALGAHWQRIQFTPDLLPSDVTGVSVFHQSNERFVFHPGPVFANVVLADEVNRASPRTQAALLEVMEERTVTVDAVPHALPSPFMVIATQNPVEMAGTYPLPEAQLDRFLMRASLGYPTHDAEVAVLRAHHAGARVQDIIPVAAAGSVLAMMRVAAGVHVAEAVHDYIVRLVAATREDRTLQLGASPRGAIGLLRAGRVLAAASGRAYVLPQDVQKLAGAVLSHRVILSPQSEAAGVTAESVIAEIVARTPAPQPARSDRQQPAAQP
ncbi:MAG: AAA family ATPase [Candidatus Nanopelagicales bacterium]